MYFFITCSYASTLKSTALQIFTGNLCYSWICFEQNLDTCWFNCWGYTGLFVFNPECFHTFLMVTYFHHCIKWQLQRSKITQCRHFCSLEESWFVHTVDDFSQEWLLLPNNKIKIIELISDGANSKSSQEFALSR